MQQGLIADWERAWLRRWSIVPVLACAGFISGIYTMLFTGPVLTSGITKEYQLAFIGSVSLGLTISAALGSLGFIRSWKAVTTLVAATLVSHFIYQFAIEERLLLPATFFLMTLLLHSAFVAVLVPGRKKLWAPVIALVSALPAALFVAFVDTAYWSIIWNGDMLGLLWQTALAGFLGVALAVARVAVKSPPKRFAVLCVLVGYFLVCGTWSHFAFIREGKRLQEIQGRRDAKLAAHLAGAPSRDNLPYMGEQSLDRVLLMDGVGDWKPFRSGSTEMEAERHQGGYAAVAPRPERIEYSVRYSRIALVPEDTRWLRATVTQYPNRAWAEYDVVNRTPFWFEVQSLTRFGTHLRQADTAVWWSSGNMLVVLDYDGHSMTGDFDELVKAYLAKYPSSFR